MSNFLSKTNKSGRIGAGLVLAGAILFILWAVWLSDGNGVSNFISTGSIVLAGVLFLSGVAYIASQSGKGK